MGRQMAAGDASSSRWTELDAYSGPSSVCAQFRLSGTMLSRAISISAGDTHQSASTTPKLITPGSFGEDPYLAEHLRFNGFQWCRQRAWSVQGGRNIRWCSPGSKFSLMVKAAEVCWLIETSRSGNLPSELRRRRYE